MGKRGGVQRGSGAAHGGPAGVCNPSAPGLPTSCFRVSAQDLGSESVSSSSRKGIASQSVSVLIAFGQGHVHCVAARAETAKQGPSPLPGPAASGPSGPSWGWIRG